MSSILKNLIYSLLLVLTIVASAQAHNHSEHKNTEATASSTGNIVDVAANAGTFKTLVSAAKAAGLVPALTGEGPLTVFAPSDEAFGALPVGTVQSLLKEENRDKLVRILSYHVVSGKVGSDALANDVSLDTLAGPRMVFTQSELGFTVEGARIVATDIDASNGVIHVIDRVIMPPQRMSRVDAEQMIISAIQNGVPMFNQGHHQATTTIYSNTAKALLKDASLLKAERDRLQDALNESAGANAMQGAWMLRFALDEVMASLRSDLSA